MIFLMFFKPTKKWTGNNGILIINIYKLFYKTLTVL